MPAGTVVISIGESKCTKADLECSCQIMDEMLSWFGRESGEEWLSVRRRVLEQMVNRELLVAEAAKRNVQLTAAEVAAHQKAFMKDLPPESNLRFDDVLRRLGNKAVYFQRGLLRDALAFKMDRLLKRELAERVVIDEAAIQKRKEDILKTSQAMASTNAALCAMATNAWRSVRAGNDFKTVGEWLAKKRPGVEYDEVCVSDLPEALQLKKGEMTSPLHSENGVTILKRIADVAGDRRFSRLFFKFGVQMDSGRLEKELQKLKAAEAAKAFRQKLKSMRSSQDVFVRTF